MSLIVRKLSAGAHITGQPELGRRHFGVPIGGPFDRESAIRCNQLLDNEGGAPVLELAGWGGEFEVRDDLNVAIVGASHTVAQIDGIDSPINRSWRLVAGQRMNIGPIRGGARIYVALAGGIDGDIGLGEWLVSKTPRRTPPRHLADRLVSVGASILRAVPYDEASASLLKSVEFSVSMHSNRAGVRLSGLSPSNEAQGLSQPQPVGVIQWTPSGEIIIIGPDGPSVGGYQRLGVVIDADLDKVGQLAPMTSVIFEITDWLTAVRLREGYRSRLRSLSNV